MQRNNRVSIMATWHMHFEQARCRNFLQVLHSRRSLLIAIAAFKLQLLDIHMRSGILPVEPD